MSVSPKLGVQNHFKIFEKKVDSWKKMKETGEWEVKDMEAM